jgi:uncharacterized protein
MRFTENDLQLIQALLGREPRGLEEVAVRDKDGVPMVVRVSPLVNDKPFPTLFWLIDKRLNYAIDQVEAGGLIAQLQAQVDQSKDLQARMEIDHRAHIELRQSYISDTLSAQIEALGYSQVFTTRGIGGIADFQRIRCLHTYYAAHLVNPNTVGKLLDHYWRQVQVTFPHLATQPQSEDILL